MKLLKSFLPTIISLTIIMPIFVSILIFSKDKLGETSFYGVLFLEISAFFLFWFLSILFFPRIVVTILKGKKTGSDKESKKLILWAGGKKIYEGSENKLPLQFAFQVWRKDIYRLYLDIGEDKPLNELANTFENHVYHTTFCVNKDD